MEGRCQVTNPSRRSRRMTSSELSRPPSQQHVLHACPQLPPECRVMPPVDQWGIRRYNNMENRVKNSI